MEEDSGLGARSGELVRLFVPDDVHVWLSASVEGESDSKFGESGAEPSRGKSVKVLIEDSVNGTIIKEERWLHGVDVSTLPLQNLDVGGVDNMTNLGYLHEASILFNLKRRFESHQPYTRTGQIVIAVNPYKWLDIYGKDSMKLYASKMWHELPSHVFATSAEAYRGMRERGKQQSILVSGESGAGKTETVKIMLNMVAVVASEAGSSPRGGGRGAAMPEGDEGIINGVVQKILLANPLLESFGNAKTIRNDNSSRFGKFMTLQFDASSGLIGSQCSTYLLEKSRVVAPAEGERSYHVFYQLCAGATNDERSELSVPRDPAEFEYLAASSALDVDGRDDARECDALRTALATVGIDELGTKEIFRTVSAVLWLGNVEFVDRAVEGECFLILVWEIRLTSCFFDR